MSHLGAVQAQDYNQLLWAIGARLPDVSFTEVESQVSQRTLIRSWCMRGTIHLILAQDANWMRALFAPRLLANLPKKAWSYHHVTARMADHGAQVLTDALASGTAIRRDVLTKELGEAGIPNDHQQGYFLFSYFCLMGLLCVGPNENRQQTFALLKKWAPDQRQLSHEASLNELAFRFFSSHGPATVADFAYWSGLPTASARAGHDFARANLHRETIDGTEYWMSPETVNGGRGTYLLSAYDESLIGLQDRRAHFQRFGQLEIATYNSMFFPTIVFDGQIGGLWKRTVKKNKVTIDLHLLPGAAQGRAMRAANGVASFYRLPADTKIGDPPPRKRAKAAWGTAKAAPKNSETGLSDGSVPATRSTGATPQRRRTAR